MKQKSIVWRVLATFLLVFLYGGDVDCYATMTTWGKLDKSARTFTFYYTDKDPDNLGPDEYLTIVDEDNWPCLDCKKTEVAQYIEKAIIDESFADFRPKT